MKDQKERVKKELLSLKKQGRLQAEDVVEFARDPNTALHSEFGEYWDDTIAAHEYRLGLARRIIRVVVFLEPHTEKEVNVFVHLKADRTRGGGYRETATVLSTKELREELLNQALEEFKYWEQKYNSLLELAPIFAVASKVTKSQKTRQRRRLARA